MTEYVLTKEEIELASKKLQKMIRLLEDNEVMLRKIHEILKNE